MEVHVYLYLVLSKTFDCEAKEFFESESNNFNQCYLGHFDMGS